MYPKKLAMFMAAGALAMFLGSHSAQAQVIPPADSDGDTFTDDVDQCLISDLSLTVVVGGTCDTGIVNTINSTGCSLADLVTEIVDTCADGAKNHGKFVSCVSHETNFLKRARTITGKQKGKIQKCAAHSDIP
jgi:hypothetical protein